ncbi:unnamed protein product [Oppiella nova]|uniref:Proline dehydrogenase n=1 Tax=Oppiella nova TaxID=334625 RepID=A0A7R9L7A5_9ACAR|nr:unnamed protein product [Oppiella nova]CAG2156480.1 unnamed protein product [Oppiella nova]
MCLAEALLRIPDSATRDLLIRDKINQGNWKDHLGQSNLMFVNAAAWGLMLTGKLMETPKQTSLSGILTSLLARTGKGIIRKAVDAAMRMMGEQFVTGETIEEALDNAKTLEDKGFRYSYDMLGEAALTEHDADRYFEDYTQAIHAIGKASEEEADRLELSLELLERLCFEPQLANWKGIGFVIQAYQKRCFYVVDYIIDLAKRSQKRLMIRLVKGAYWDSEIKKAQIDAEINSQEIRNPADHSDLVGYVIEAETAQVDLALDNAHQAFENWKNASQDFRAELLLKAATIMESRIQELMRKRFKSYGKQEFQNQLYNYFLVVVKQSGQNSAKMNVFKALCSQVPLKLLRFYKKPLHNV